MVTRRTPTFPAGSDCPNRAQPCFLSRLACRFSFRLFDAGFLAGFPLLSLFATNITLQPRSGRFIGACRDRPTSLDSRRPRTSVLSRVGTVLRCSITRYHEFAASLVAQSGHVRVRRCHRRCRPQRSGSRSGTHAFRSACARRRGSRRHRRRDANRGVDLPPASSMMCVPPSIRWERHLRSFAPSVSEIGSIQRSLYSPPRRRKCRNSASES